MTSDYTIEEIQICRIAQLFRGEVVAAAATTLSDLATRLAKLVHDDDLVLVGNGLHSAFDCDPGPYVPADEFLLRPSAQGYIEWPSVFDLSAAGKLRVVVGPVQVDRAGNANLSVIGDWYKPRVQLIGSRGLPDNLWRLEEVHFHVPHHSPRTVVDRVDFVSTFGYGETRDRLGNDLGRPTTLVSDLGVFTWPREGGDMQVESLHPGVTAEQVRAATGFPLEVPDDCPVTELPTPEEARAIREVLDPFDYRSGSPRDGDHLGEKVAALLRRQLATTSFGATAEEAQS